MSTFTRGAKAPGICERCGFRYRLSQLQFQVEGGKRTELLVCPSCLDVDNPQYMAARLKVTDPQRIRRPAPPREVERVLFTDARLDVDFVLDQSQLT